MVVDPLYCCFTLLCTHVLHTFNVKEFYTTIGLIMYVVVETCHAVGIVENQIAHKMPIFEEITCVIDCIADISYCVVCSCMQTQQMLELDKRDGVIIRPWSNIPPQEQMMSRT
ncbi:unnamed protein product [Sphagnum jensenii]|uniref:Uncharacterized protein n=1 Tax=Sphagnum jensenii TaxID=128206 RepID=A0ABP1ATV2_9BRYO